MRKSAIMVLLLLLLPNETMANHTQSDELIDMTAFVTSEDLAVEEWQVTIKEQMEREKVKKVIEELKNRYNGTVAEDENIIEYSFRDVHNSVGIIEHYKVLIPKDENYQSEINVLIEGKAWNESIKESYVSRKHDILNQYFTMSAKIFSCLTTIDHGIINSVYFIQKIKQQFGLQHVTTQNDTVENSMHKNIVYGYTPMWSEKITITDKPVNFQLVVTATENGKSNYTIGTPILIDEY
ncbi:YwmB family TATA-box binding protein [Virgibacillus byunsanensis]|uniref:YwmB family TATA-box binding protein n=1 Tax=Virgibacillus byunsanensis TaxID=570945 RepID=A0ABW3LEN7_9BACI